MEGEDVCGNFDSARLSSRSTQSTFSDSISTNVIRFNPTGPKFSQFSHVSTRERTFSDWPPGLEQSPVTLAKAGFFYIGKGDHVQCFYCSGILKNWETNDDPFEEHAKWFPECPYLQTVKGKDFIKLVAEKKPANLPLLEQQLHINYRIIEEKAVSKERKNISQIYEDCDSAYGSLENNEENLCKICYEEELGIVFLPCGHFACCPSCAPAFSKCPICRTPIEQVIRTFQS